MDLTTTASMELHFDPEERCLRHVRLSISSFVLVVNENRDLASRVAMTAAEMVENAVKYTSGKDLTFRLSVKLGAGQSRVRVETENEATPQRLGDLSRVLKEVQVGTGMEAYMRALAAVPEKSAHESKLGLARIRYEGQMDVRADVVGSRIRMIAETHQ